MYMLSNICKVKILGNKNWIWPSHFPGTSGRQLFPIVVEWRNRDWLTLFIDNWSTWQKLIHHRWKAILRWRWHWDLALATLYLSSCHPLLLPPNLLPVNLQWTVRMIMAEKPKNSHSVEIVDAKLDKSRVVASAVWNVESWNYGSQPCQCNDQELIDEWSKWHECDRPLISNQWLEQNRHRYNQVQQQ